MEERPSARDPWFWAAAAAALGAIAMPVLNPDLYWHLSAGRYMLENLRLPSVDFLSWTEYGAPWTDFEWLVQVIYLAVHSLGGIPGLFILKTVLLGATFFVLYRMPARRWLGAAASFALPLWGLALMANSDLRPENFSVLMFALLLWRLEEARAGDRPFPASPAGYAGLALFFALWANLHAGFAYGLLLAASYGAGNWAGHKLWGGRRPGPLELPAALLAAFAGTLLNPWGYRLYSILAAHAADSAAMSRYLAEWAPPSIANPLHWPFMLFLAASFLLLLLRFLRERRVPPAHLLTLAWLAFEASRHTRHIVFFSMAAVVVSLDAAARLWGADLLRRRGRLALALAVVYLAAAVWPRYLSFRTSVGAEASGGAAYLKANAARLASRKLYNPWAWGGYLGWALAPGYKVFADGRYIFHKYLGPVSAAMADQDSWEKYAAGKGLGLVVFRRDYAMLPYGRKTRGSVVGIRRPSYLLVMPEEKWALVYWDAFSLVFARREGALPPEFRLLRPDDFDDARLALCSGEVPRERLEAELAAYYGAAAGARSTREADLMKAWLAGFPASCPPLNAGK